MDSNVTDNSSNKSTNVEQNQHPIDCPETNKTECNEVEIKGILLENKYVTENVNEKSVEECAMNEKPTQKGTIQILNVEVLSPVTENPVNAEHGKEKSMDGGNVEEFVENKVHKEDLDSSQNLDSEEVLKEIKNESVIESNCKYTKTNYENVQTLQMGHNVQTNEMEINEKSIQTPQTEDTKNSEDNIESTINRLEPIYESTKTNENVQTPQMGHNVQTNEMEINEESAQQEDKQISEDNIEESTINTLESNFEYTTTNYENVQTPQIGDNVQANEMEINDESVQTPQTEDTKNLEDNIESTINRLEPIYESTKTNENVQTPQMGYNIQSNEMVINDESVQTPQTEDKKISGDNNEESTINKLETNFEYTTTNYENVQTPQMGDNVQANEMEINDESVQTPQTEDKKISGDNTEESTINTSETNFEYTTTNYENVQTPQMVHNIQSNEMEINDESVQTPQTEDKKILGDNIEKSTINTLEFSNSIASTSLGLLAQYDSDNDEQISDTDSVIEVPSTSARDYRNQVVEIDSESDSDDTSDSSDVECLDELRKTIEKRMEVVDEDEEEDEDENEEDNGKRKRRKNLRVKGEMLLEDLPPIQDLQITVPEDECIEFGKIHSIVDQLVLVSALPKSILLDLETVIFLEKGQKVLGQVFDVLGQVADPLYCVRFNSNKQIKEKQIIVGEVVYVAPKTQYTQYVILSNLVKLKGSDASWENDIEPPPRFLDYSDDEQEQLARRQSRNRDRPVDNDDPTKRPRTMDDENNSTENRYQYKTQRNHYNEQRNYYRGGQAGHFNTRPRYNGPPHNQQRTFNPNHHRSSWHSNYYPQSSDEYSRPPAHNQQQSSPAYPPHVPIYAMPPMRYPRPPPPHMLHPHPSQLMPNAFSIRAPTLHGPPPPPQVSNQQYTSPPPPPPSSQ